MASDRISYTLVTSAAAIWPPLCLGAVCLRFYSRRVDKVRLGPDDWLTIPALVFLQDLVASRKKRKLRFHRFY